MLELAIGILLGVFTMCMLRLAKDDDEIDPPASMC